MLNDRRPASAPMRARRPCALVALAAAAACALTACSDDAPNARKNARPATAPPGAHEVTWLDVGSPITPAQWLASRGEDKVRPADDADVARLGKKLAAAHVVYRESERMIANRAVQLSDMLASLGIDEDASTVLDELLEVTNGAGMEEGFGAVSQHYYNLRASKVSRDEALTTLKARYGGK